MHYKKAHAPSSHLSSEARGYKTWQNSLLFRLVKERHPQTLSNRALSNMATSMNIASVDFSGQTALVTGTTNGLGRAISEELVKRKVSTLIMGVRNIQRGEEVKAALLAKPELRAVNPGVMIHVLELEMGDYKSDVAFVDKVRKVAQAIDIVLLNAGLGSFEFKTTKTGHEETMQVNVYSNAVLALQLLSLLERTAKAKSKPTRLTWVGSFVQMDHSLKKQPLSNTRPLIPQFDEKAKFNGITRYSDSKLMGTMFVQELAERVDKNLVILNEVSPGRVLTNFGASAPIYVRVALTVIGLVVSKSKLLAQGCNKYLHAIAVAGVESHGAYLSDYKITP